MRSSFAFRLACVVFVICGLVVATQFAKPAGAANESWKINFQTETTSTPDGYLADFGRAFDTTRGYGWEDSAGAPLSRVENGRERGIAADKRLDTFVCMQVGDERWGLTTPGQWELAVPSGEYTVTLAVGEPVATDPNSYYVINAEGNKIVDFRPTPTDTQTTVTASVTVTDGRLTLDANGGTDTRLDYVDVTRSAYAPPPAAAAYTKVVNIWMENQDKTSIIGSSDAPFINSMADTYGYATNFQDLTHPSLPNYIAASSGEIQNITDDLPPIAHLLDGQSLFGQLTAAGKTWKSYEEDMPTNCDQTDSGTYAVKHNPAAYFVPLLLSCETNDVPLGSLNDGALSSDIANGLPDFSFVTPNLCNDMHDCSVSTGDTWLRGWVSKLMSGPDYTQGHLAIIISWDESEGSSLQPEVVISPTTHGVRAAEPFNEYDRLRALEDIFGVAHLGEAANVPSAYRSAFNLQ